MFYSKYQHIFRKYSHSQFKFLRYYLDNSRKFETGYEKNFEAYRREAITAESLNQKAIEINAITYFFKSKSYTIMTFGVNILSRTRVKH